MMFDFIDRTEAGEQLGEKLLEDPSIKTAARNELLVLSIPRGGVVVGVAVAQTLGCAHDVIVVKKIGYPGQPEFAIGAVAEDGAIVLNQLVVSGLKENYVAQEIEQTQASTGIYINKFRQGRALNVQSKTVIVVDDGVATGETVKAAIIWLCSKSESQRPKRAIVAVPVCSSRAAIEFQEMPVDLVCLKLPDHFWAVSQFYWDFDQISDETVIDLLKSTAALPRENLKSD